MFCLFTLLARWLGIDALKPVPNLGGIHSIAQETARIKALSKAGIAVPTILDETSEGLLLADAVNEGQPSQTFLHKLLSVQSVDEIDHYLALGSQALNDVHARQCYLSEAFARNILVNKEDVVFIDFETDPGEIHALTNYMVRDWHCLIFSLYGKLSKCLAHRERLSPVLLHGFHQAQPEVQLSHHPVASQALKALSLSAL